MGENSFKDDIKQYYNLEAELRNSKNVRPEWVVKVRDYFCNLVKNENKNTLLELGAGVGYDSKFFMDNGLNVTAIDISSSMVDKCKEKNIEAYELDFYNLVALNRTFDCVYAINTLLHVPKNDLSYVLSKISLVLNDNGLFYMGLYGGDDTENIFINSEVSNSPRLFTFYSANYLKLILMKHFNVIFFETIDIGTETEKEIFYSIVLRKKEVQNAKGNDY